MPWGSSGLLQNTGTSKGAFHRLAEGTLLNYLELTDCNTMLRSPLELGSFGQRAARLPSPPQGRTDGRWARLCADSRGGGTTGLCRGTASTPQLVFYWEKHFQRSLVGRGGGDTENLATT